jgi:hypothetical protein
MKKLTRILSLIIFISATTTRPALEWTRGVNLALSAVLGLLTYLGTDNSGTKPKAADPEIRLDFRYACKTGKPYSSVVNQHASNSASPSSSNLSLVLALVVCCGTYAFLEHQTKKA